jgi:Protein of unknown function (DUF3052)
MSGYSGTPLVKKLGLRSGARLYLRDAPQHYAQLLGPAFSELHRMRRMSADTDVAHLFATQRSQLQAALADVRRTMRDDAVIWVSWPKKASGVATDITEGVVRELALPTGLVDIKVCAVDETWSALKLVLRRSERAAPASARRPQREVP